MRIRHPYEWLSDSAQNRALGSLVALTIVVMAAMYSLDGPLRTAAAPRGIVSFELAGGLSQAREILASWDREAEINAALSLGVDYLFLVAYSLSISLACVRVARAVRRRSVFATAGCIVAWAQFLAALLDAVENYALIQLLRGSARELWPAVAWWCAVPKFGIVAVGLIYVLVGLVVVALRPRS